MNRSYMMSQRKGIAMFTEKKCKQFSAFNSACERFAAQYVLSDVAKKAGLREQMLRNKLNPDQPHQLTVDDLIKLYQATGDETLIERTIELNANVSGLGSHALQIHKNGRITRTQRNMVVNAATVAMGELAILINEFESKFQTVPGLGCAIDAARTVAGV